MIGVQPVEGILPATVALLNVTAVAAPEVTDVDVFTPAPEADTFTPAAIPPPFTAIFPL